MKNTTILIALALFFLNSSFSQTYDFGFSVGSSNTENGKSIAKDLSGNIYVFGNFSQSFDFDHDAAVNTITSQGGSNSFIAKYSTTGSLLWVKTFSGTEYNYPYSMEVSTNNIVLTGRFSGTVDFDPSVAVQNKTSTGGYDVFLVSLDLNGNFGWSVTFGNSSIDDSAEGLHVNLTGEIYVTGSIRSTNLNPNGTAVMVTTNNTDMFVAKYTSTGILEWHEIIGNTFNGEIGKSIQLNNQNQLVIAGQFQGTVDFNTSASNNELTSNGLSDVFILILNPTSGSYLSVTGFGGASTEDISDIVIDASNNIYLTGYFQSTCNFGTSTPYQLTSTTFDPDIYFAKYSPSGNFIWANSIGGTIDDRGSAIDIDNSGNVYITGHFHELADFDPSPNDYFIDGLNWNIYLAKYSTNGEFLFAHSFGTNQPDFSSDLLVDSDQSIFLTGGITNSVNFDLNGTQPIGGTNYLDYFLVKYTQIPCTTPNQPDNIVGNSTVNPSTSETYSVTNDATATGYIWTLPSGWSGTSTTNTINVTTGTTGGTISVCAQNSCGIGNSQTLSVSNSGTSSSENHDWTWAKSSNNPNAAQYIMNTATDSDDNSYITGWFNSSTLVLEGITLTKVGSGTNVYLAKYDPNSNVLWAKNAGGGSSNADCWDIVVDASSNVYISGTFPSPSITFEGTSLNHNGSGSDIFVAKYNSTGGLIWAKDFDYTSSISVYDLNIDINGNILLAGTFSSADLTLGSTTLLSSANSHPFLAKLDSDGNVLWAKASQNSTSYANYGSSITSDFNGNVFFSGNYTSSASNPFIIEGITLPFTNFNRDIFLAKFDPMGNIQWVKNSVGTTSSSGGDYPYNLACDAEGNVIMIGTLRSIATSFDAITATNSNSNNTPDIFIAKYDTNGNAIWAKNGGGLGYDEGHRITTDSDNNIYATGYFESKPASFGAISINKENSNSPIIFIAKYDEDGTEKWVKHVENTSAHSGNLPANGISINSLGNIYVGGTAYSNAVFGSTTLAQGGIFLAKLGPSIVSTQEVSSNESQIEIYPNPFSSLVTIKSNELINEIVLLDLNGKIIINEVVQNNQVIELNLESLTPGMYLINTITEKGAFTSQLIKN